MFSTLFSAVAVLKHYINKDYDNDDDNNDGDDDDYNDGGE